MVRWAKGGGRAWLIYVRLLVGGGGQGVGSLYVSKSSMIQFVGSWISFLDSLLYSWLIVWVYGINKCGWCLAAGRGCWLKALCQILSVGDYFTIPYTSTFIRLSNFYQECHVSCIVIMINGGMGKVGVVYLY